MNRNQQSGYMDNQVMPVMIGAVLMFALLGQVPPAGVTEGTVGLKLYGFLAGATLVLLYGFIMHIYSLAYPESPFNKHSPPLFINLVCAGITGLAAHRFYSADLQVGMWVYAGLCGLVLVISLAVSLQGQDHKDE